MSCEGWLTEVPPERIEAAEVVLTRGSALVVEEFIVAVNASLDHLRPWMPWAQEPANAQSIGGFLLGAEADWVAHRAFQYIITASGGSSFLGCCGLHARLGPGALEIGYWVHADHVGRGVATAAAGALTSTALSLAEVERVEIRCDAANARSAAVARRLGYRLDRIETRIPRTPGETDALMIWVLDRVVR
jgi:RimJ/RimL family protein N-acetyltransferase